MRRTLVIAVVFLCRDNLLAHEGHEPLPTKGATVRGDRLSLSPAAAKAIGVRTAKVKLSEVRRTVGAVGTVELPWTQQAYASSLVGGRIERVLVKPGESVTAGQELARVAGAEFESLQLALLQSAAEKLLAQQMLKSHESVGEGIAGKVLLQSRAEVQQQSARWNVAWQKLRALGLSDSMLQKIADSGSTLPTISIVTPMSGVVAMADVRPGQIVQPTERLYHIVDPSRVWVVGQVLEADAGRIERGQSVEISFAMLPERSFRASIDHVELQLNSDRTLSVKSILDNADGVLKPGMFARLGIHLATEKAVVCPKEALIADGLSRYALVEQTAGRYVRKRVVVAAIRGDTAEIEDGLFPGDPVVTVGSHELASLFAKRHASQASSDGKVAAARVAQGQIELPTSQKSFASSPIEGRVHRILVEHGQRVQKGEVLAELESLTFQSLQLDLVLARTNLEQTTRNLRRAQSLDDAIPRKELWQFQTQHDTNQHLVASLRRQLALAGLSESEIAAIEATDITGSPGELSPLVPIRAPADGWISGFDLIPGQFVAQDVQLFELHDPTRVWVRAFLFQQDALDVRIGQTAVVSLASDPGYRAVGNVDRLDPVLSGGQRALSIWIELDNPHLQLKEGMAASVTIPTGKPILKAEK